MAKRKTKGTSLKPGQKAPTSGQYESSAGGEVTAVKGKKLPPGPKKGTTYKLTDKTKSRKK